MVSPRGNNELDACRALQYRGNKTVRSRKLQSLLDAQVGKGGLRGVVVALQSHDQSLDFIGAAGTANPDTGLAMTPETPYFIASVTKMFTAAIVMQLHVEGRLDLEAEISRYLPASMLDGIHVYKGTDFGSRLKVFQLVNQTSGLADFEADRPRGGKSVLDALKAGHDRAIDIDEALHLTRNLSPRFAPGTPGRAHYSNLNYRLLGEIVQSLTHESMADNFEERICLPLGLRQTYLYDWTKPRSAETPATVYLNSAPADVPKYLSSNISDGGLVSTASECMAFLRAFFEGRLFDKTLLKRMQTWNSIFFPLRYGYGLMYFRLPRRFWFSPLPEFVGHSGSTGSFAFMCPSRLLYLTGTLNRISPARPYFFMMQLVRAAT